MARKKFELGQEVWLYYPGLAKPIKAKVITEPMGHPYTYDVVLSDEIESSSVWDRYMFDTVSDAFDMRIHLLDLDIQRCDTNIAALHTKRTEQVAERNQILQQKQEHLG